MELLALLLRDQSSPVLSALQSHQQPVRSDALLHQLNTNVSLILVGKRFYCTKPPFSTVSECLWCFTSGLCPNRNDIFLSSLLLRDIKSVECRSTETLTLFLSYASSECSQFRLPPGRAAFLVWLLLRVDYEERRFSREGFSFLHFPPCCSVFMFNWRTVLSTLCVLPFSPLLPLMTRFIH